MDWNEIVAALAATQTGNTSEWPGCTEAITVMGGDINAAYELRCGTQSFFVKLNSPDKLPMFEQEAEMLEQLRQSGGLRVPEPLLTGVMASHAYIVMEFLTIEPVNEQSAEQLGEGLAQLHQISNAQYGWADTGWLGLSRQPNQPSDNWCEFWRTYRLGFQLRQALRNGIPPHIGSRLELLNSSVEGLLGNHQPAPALLHGDCWHGNCGMDSTGRAVIFDPACYFGDAEADLALTELFGGFPDSFYRAYWSVQPRAAEYEVRSQLYQLYHVLNHFNLFGGLYGHRAGTMAELLLAEMGH